MIRDITEDDAAAVTAIYNYYIEHTVITFEEEKISPADITNRIQSITPHYPWLVYEVNNAVAGYAYASQFRQRTGYRFSTETTVYVMNDFAGQGIGSALYRELISRLRDRKFKVAYGAIALPNPASVHLHERLGFRKAAHFTNAGFKFNRWIDVGYWELLL